MSAADETTDRRGRFGGWRSRATWVGAAVVALVALVLALTSGDDRGTPSPSTAASGTASPTASSSPSSDPSVSPTVPVETPGAQGPDEPVTPGEPAPDEPVTPPGEPGAARPTAVPVPIDAAAAPEPQVEVQLAKIEAVEGEANIPGEVGGPSLRITVVVRNATAAELDLTSAVVNLYFGPERSPAIELLEPGRRDLPQSVAPGGEVTGAFVFLVPVEARDDVVVEFDLSTDSTVLLFAGSVG